MLLRDVNTWNGLDVRRPFTTGMAAEHGIAPARLTQMCRAGLAVRLFKGVYRAADTEESLALRVAAVKLVAPQSAVVTDLTAAWLHGADVLPPGSHQVVPSISVFHLAGCDRMRVPYVHSGERTLRESDLTEIDGVRATTPLRTAYDLGRLLPRGRAFAALDALLGLDRFTRHDLLSGVERFAGQRGVVQLRALAPLADGRAESPPESILRLHWLDLSDLPRPRPQVWVEDEDGHPRMRLDVGDEENRVAAEYDGEAFHGDDEREHDESRREWLAGRGWTVEVFTKADLFGPLADPSAKLYAAYRRAGRPR